MFIIVSVLQGIMMIGLCGNVFDFKVSVMGFHVFALFSLSRGILRARFTTRRTKFHIQIQLKVFLTNLLR